LLASAIILKVFINIRASVTCMLTEETVDRWCRSVGWQRPGRNGKTGGEQRRLPVLSSWSRLRLYIGHGKL